MPFDHEFGNQHTELKLSVVEKYLRFFATALRGKFDELWYIDAFAGTGSRIVRHEERPPSLLDAGEPERIERRRGSARIAIDVSPPFDFIVFIENNHPISTALEELVANDPNRRVVVVKNDANDALKSLIATNNWRYETGTFACRAGDLIRWRRGRDNLSSGARQDTDQVERFLFPTRVQS